jgi:TonB-linked SusC/RagA family outer membrane protein
MKKFGLLLTTFLLFLGSVLAQTVTITGKVIDDKGAGISNASVQIKGAKGGTVTSKDGSFTIKVPQNAKALIISSVNFTPQEVSIVGKSTVNVSLATYDASLDEVVVTGYGAAKKRTELVGQVTVVKAKDVQDRPSANVIDALQGRVAGVQVFTSSGEPSATPSVRINGVGSLSGSNTPLYILDGIPVSPGSIVSMNPEDYESINVLTDASSTSIYGARAANGVIVFTSKRGSAQKTRINVTAQYSQSNLISNTQNFFNNMMNAEELGKFWVASGYQTQAQVNTLRTNFPNDTRWADVYYLPNRPTEQVDVNISGGSGKTTYFVSGSYFYQQGLAYRSDFKRYTLRSNINTTINNWASMGLLLTGSYDTRQLNPYGTNNTNRGLALLAPPFYTPIDPLTGQNYTSTPIPGWNRFHPNYLTDNVRSVGENMQLTPQAYIQLSPIKNLTIKTTAGMEAYDYNVNSQTLPSFANSVGNGNVSRAHQREVSRTVNTVIDYKFKIKENHDFSVMVGNEFIDNTDRNFSASSAGLTDNRLLLLSAGPTQRNVAESYTGYAFTSFFGRLSYGFKNKYLIDLTTRQDQSSRFGIDNRTANFYSVGAVWKVKKEKFLDNARWINELNVKGSYGTSGNSAIGNFTSQGLVGTNIYGGASGLGIASPGNSSLGWEQQGMMSLSINGRIFKHYSIVLEYYDRQTSNMLVSVPYPQTTGFANINGNVGKMQNRGWNVTLNADYGGKDWSFSPYVNFNYNHNKITELFQDRNYWIQANTGVLWAVDKPVSYVYPIFAGVDPANGNATWFLPDPNPNNVANTIKDPTKVTSTFSATALQQNTGLDRYPPFAGGFGFQASYKGFYTQWDFSFVSGKYLINNDRFFYENPGQFPGFNQFRTVNNFWQKAGDQTQFPRVGVQFTQFDSRLIEDASFLRAKAIQFGYDFNRIIKKNNVITGLKAFVIARNLFTFTNYQGPDPEVDSNIGLGTNPNTRQVSFGIDITF